MENQNVPTKLAPPIPKPQKWYNRKSTFWMLILVMVTGGVIGVYFILNLPQDFGPIVITRKSTKQNSVATSTPIPNSITTSVPSGWVYYQQPDDGWKIAYPPDWETIEMLVSVDGFDVRNIFLGKNPNPTTFNQSSVTVEVSTIDSATAKGMLMEVKSSRFQQSTFQGNPAYIESHDVDGGTQKTIVFMPGNKFYQLDLVTINGDDTVNKMLASFQVSTTDLTTINTSDFHKKYWVGQDLPGLIAECNKKGKNLFPTKGVEKITYENQQSSALYQTIVGQQCDSEIPTIDNGPTLIPADYYTYWSDGTNWEATVVLENKNDSQCQIVGSDCVFKVRNGIVASQK